MRSHLHKSFDNKYPFSYKAKSNTRQQINLSNLTTQRFEQKSIQKLSNEPYRLKPESDAKGQKQVKNSKLNDDKTRLQENSSPLKLSIENKNMKSTRQYRQYITKTPNLQVKGQFYAYCIVTKQSSTGLFYHQRLLLIDSNLQELRYYSKIPFLPIKDFELMRNQSKDSLKIKHTSKLTYTIEQTGLNNNVIVSCLDQGAKKQWRLGMGNKKMALQFRQLINSILRNGNLKARGLYPVVKKANYDRSSAEVENQRNISQQYQNSQQTSNKQDSYLKDFESKIQTSPIEQPTQFRPEVPYQAVKSPTKKNQNNFQQIMYKRMKAVQDTISNQKEKDKIQSKNEQRSIEERSAGTKLMIEKTQKKIESNIIFKPLEPIKNKNETLIREYASRSPRRLQKSNYSKHSWHFKEPQVDKFSRLTSDKKIDERILWIDKWVSALNYQSRAHVYMNFINKCQKKIIFFMKNFYNFRELSICDEEGSYYINDEDIDFKYSFLIEQVKQIQQASILSSKIKSQQLMIEQFEVLNKIWRKKEQNGKENQIKILPPLCCIIKFKSFAFLCKANLSSCSFQRFIIFDHTQYSELTDFQKDYRINLSAVSKQLLQIAVQNKKILYFSTIKLASDQQNNQLHDLQFSTKYYRSPLNQQLEHQTSQLIAQFVLELQSTYLLSCYDLQTKMKKYRISSMLLPQIYQSSLENQNISCLIFTEIVGILLASEIRRRIQVQIFTGKDFGSSIEKIYRSISLFLGKDVTITQNIKQLLECHFLLKLEASEIHAKLNLSFLISSVLIKLGIRCEISEHQLLKDIDSSNLKWSSFDFDEHNITFQLYPLVQSYNCYSFMSPSSRLQYYLSSQGIKDYEQNEIPNKSKQLLLLFNLKHKNQQYIECSPQYRILPKYEKSIINYLLSLEIQATRVKKRNDPKDDGAEECLQSIIYNHLISKSPYFFQTYYEFRVCIIGIKWFIKNKKYQLAEEYILDLLSNVTFWLNHIPDILIEVYDLYSLFGLTKNHEKTAKQYALKSFNLAMKSYSNSTAIDKRSVIAERALLAANIQFQFHEYETSLELYQKAEAVIAKICQENKGQYLNVEHFQIYVRKSAIHLNSNQIKACCDQALAGLQRIQQMKKVYRKCKIEMPKNKILDYELQIYEILFRCYQIKNKRTEMMKISSLCCLKFYEDQVGTIIKSTVADSQYFILRTIKIIKLAWESVIKNAAFKKKEFQSTANYRQVDLKIIREEILLLKKRQYDGYRYLKREIFQDWLQMSIKSSHKKMTNNFQNEEPLILNIIIDAVQKISLGSNKSRIFRLHEVAPNNNEFMVLEGLSVLLGYEYLIGCIDYSLHIYNFEF